MDNFAPILNDIRNQADPGEAFEKLFSKWSLENDPIGRLKSSRVGFGMTGRAGGEEIRAST